VQPGTQCTEPELDKQLWVKQQLRDSCEQNVYPFVYKRQENKKLTYLLEEAFCFVFTVNNTFTNL
jgi:hypothetical protein